MRALTILTILLFLTTPLVSAQLSDQWYRYDGTTTVRDTEFTFRLVANNEDIIRAQTPNDTGLVELDECTEIAGYEVCYLEYDYDEQEWIDDRGQLVPGIRVQINELQTFSGSNIEAGPAELTVNGDAGNPIMGETNDFELTIKNTGERVLFNHTTTITANNVALNTTKEGLFITNGEYRFINDLDTNESHTIPFTYTLQEPKNTSIEVISEYDVDGETQTQRYVYDVNIDTPLSAANTLPSTTQLYKETPGTITLQNNRQDEIPVNITAEINRNHLLLSRADENPDQQNQQSFTHNEYIAEPNETTEYQYILFPRYIGNTNLTAQTTYRYEGFTFTENHTQTTTTPPPSVDFQNTVPLTQQGSQTPIQVNITNNNPYYIHDATITAESILGEAQTTIQNISADTTKTVNLTYPVPYGVDPGTYTLDFHHEYRTPTREWFDENSQTTLTVKETAYSADIQRTLRPEEPERGDNVSVTVTVSNAGSEPLQNLAVTETTNTGYDQTTTFNLAVDEQRTTHEYTFTYNNETVLTATAENEYVDSQLSQRITPSQPQNETQNTTEINQPRPTGNQTGQEQEPGEQTPPPQQPGQEQTEEESSGAFNVLTQFVKDVETFFTNLFS